MFLVVFGCYGILNTVKILQILIQALDINNTIHVKTILKAKRKKKLKPYDSFNRHKIALT